MVSIKHFAFWWQMYFFFPFSHLFMSWKMQLIPLISIAWFLISSIICPFLILNVTSFHTPRQRPSSLNISMSFSGLLASWLLPFLKAALMPETPDLGLWIHFPAAFKQPQKFWELIFPSDLISCPPWPQPPTKVVQCCLWDQSHVSWRLLEHGCYLLLLHLSSSPFIS